MQQFVQLFTELDQTTKVNEKVDALVRYFQAAPDQDKLWTIALLSHRRPKRPISSTMLREWAAEASGVPLWLFEESYHIVGDLAETIALMLPPASSSNHYPLTYWIQYMRQLGEMEETRRKEGVWQAWDQMETAERFLFNKFITGGFRIGISQQLLIKALAKYTGIEDNVLAHRLMGHWSPDDSDFQNLLLEARPQDDLSKPYPFHLAYPLEEEPEQLGNPDEWLAERKWDGIRGQVIVRNGEVFVWSRGEELVTAKFPEFHLLAQSLPDGTVLDGEILPFKEDKILSFQLLQTRIGRKNLTKSILQSAPVVLRAYDVLEFQGKDVRQQPFYQRRAILEQLLDTHKGNGVLQLSELVPFQTWEALRQARLKSREQTSEGIMLKRKDSEYRVGRRRGDWWKWKIEALTIDAVMIYAQQGHGRRANLYTDFTFAVWNGTHLTPFTKAYSGLTDAEFQEVNVWIKKNTLERFGPVRSVKPELVFEIAFEGIQASSRHKSGVALRFPRIHRWRKDKPVREANTLEELLQLLQQYG